MNFTSDISQKMAWACCWTSRNIAHCPERDSLALGTVSKKRFIYRSVQSETLKSLYEANKAIDVACPFCYDGRIFCHSPAN